MSHSNTAPSFERRMFNPDHGTAKRMRLTMQTTNQNNTQLKKKTATLCAVTASIIALALTGCGLGNAGNSSTSSVVKPLGQGGIQGSIHGGQQPIAFSTIQLYQVGTSGNASAATPLLSPAVTSDQNGNFGITGLYTCAPSSAVYIVATGGIPLLSNGSNNSGIAMMAYLGDCATLKANAASIYTFIDEVTTVASVYTLSGFMSGYANVGYAGSNLPGILKAFSTQNTLVSTSTGTSYGPSGGTGITLPTARINSLADSISACINSGSSTSTGCTQLFTATTVNGTAPSDTIGALVNLSHNPGLNVGAIYGLAPATPPFQPTLSTAPADWTLSIGYAGGGLSLPSGVALDASGNAWVANQGSNAITELTSGSFVSGATGYTSTSIVSPQGIAVDALGNIWVANTGASSLLKLNAAGSITNTVTSGLSGPVSVALDTNNNVWVANFDSNSIAAFGNNGTPLSGSPYTNAALVGPTGLAIDPSNTVWVGNSVPGSIASFNNSGVYQNVYTDGLLVAPGGVAVDANLGQIYTAATGISAITGLTQNGAVTFYGGGLTTPLAVAVDSASTVWAISDATVGSVSAFSSTGKVLTPSTGVGTLNQPSSLAIDASGNLWTTQLGDSSVMQFVGLSAPTHTPLAP
jgi:streptogramin lyase